MEKEQLAAQLKALTDSTEQWNGEYNTCCILLRSVSQLPSLAIVQTKEMEIDRLRRQLQEQLCVIETMQDDFNHIPSKSDNSCVPANADLQEEVNPHCGR
jgi:hypothetical protein